MKILDNGNIFYLRNRSFLFLYERWLPETGGANLPALNNLLKPLGIALGDTVLEGNFDLGEHMIYYASGIKSSLLK
jgi:hypothetical protein